MRYSQLLLEFDAKMTANQLGRKISYKLRDNRDSAEFFARMFHVAKTQYGVPPNAAFISPEDKMEIFKRVDVAAIEMMMEYDPTPNHSYSRWICQRFADGGIPLYDDLAKTQRYLTIFHRLKTGGYFKRNPDKATMSDIGRFRTVSDLGEFVQSIPDDDALSNAGQDRKLEERLISSGDARVILNTDRFKVTVPMTAEAATFFGRNTQWCTTAENGGHFEYYADRGTLFIILDKPANRRWQFHFEDQQFMDENDRQVAHAPGKINESWVFTDRFPPEFWSVIPAEMFLVGHWYIPVRECPTPLRPQDFDNLSQFNLKQVAHHIRDTEIREMAVARMDLQNTATLFGTSLKSSLTPSLKALAEILQAHLITFPTPSLSKRTEGGMEITTGVLLEAMIDNLRTTGQPIALWKAMREYYIQAMSKGSMNDGLVIRQADHTLYAFYKAGDVYYASIDPQGKFSDFMHGETKDWVHIRLRGLEANSKEPGGNEHTGLTDVESQIMLDTFKKD